MLELWKQNEKQKDKLSIYTSNKMEESLYINKTVTNNPEKLRTKTYARNSHNCLL